MNAVEPLVIQTQGLSKSYKQVDALKSLDLHVPEKSIFAFLGPNGAGTLAPALQVQVKQRRSSYCWG